MHMKKNAQNMSRGRTVMSLVKKMFLVLVLLPFAFVALYMVYPNVGKLRDRDPEKTSFMRFREREWKRGEKNGEIVKTWVPLSRISSHAVLAVTISEDDKFWTHEGFDIEGIRAAAEKNLKQKKLKYGGSTISQQLAKNLYLSPDKNILRKVKETILTWRIEHTLSKKRIIELYLNVAEWGDGIFGIEAASRAYFHRSTASLTAEQAARLAAVLPNPRRYRADASTGYIVRRANGILSIMARRGVAASVFDELSNESEKKDEAPTTPSDSTVAAEPEPPGPVEPAAEITEPSATPTDSLPQEN